MKKCKCKRRGPLGILIFLAVFAAAAAVVMLLWNAILPAISGIGVIGYWQAAGLMILFRLLVGGFGRHGRGRDGHFHPAHLHERNPEEMRRMREKFRGMSAEERREHIRRHMEGCSGDAGSGKQEEKSE